MSAVRTARKTATLALFLALAATTPAAAQQTAADRTQALLGLGRVKRDAGDFVAARRYFDDARKLRPFNSSELVEFFWIVAGRDNQTALAAGQDILRASPGSRDVRDRLITEALTLGNETLVVSLAEEGHRLEPTSSRWPRRAADSFLRQGKLAEAATALKQVVAATDATGEDRINLALSLEQSAQYAEARAAWEQVPAATRASNDGYSKSWLRSLAHSASASESANELETWLVSHRTDDEIRELLVGIWTRAGRPDKAAAALSEIPSGAGKVAWLRRRAGLARDAGLRDVAISSMEAIAAATKSSADRRTLAAWLVEDRQYTKAAVALRQLMSVEACNVATLEIIDRIPGEEGTTLLMEALATPKCASVQWIDRTTQRAISESRLQDALRMVRRLPAPASHRPETLRLTGQILMWTGDADAAIATLHKAQASAPADLSIRETLVDAFRANHDPDSAWKAAAPLIADGNPPVARLLTVAELALEVERPADAARLLDRLPQDRQRDPAVVALRGRVYAAQGQAALARTTLSSLAVASVGSAAAVAWIDSELEITGVKAALGIARQFTMETSGWRDVMSRRIRLESLVGDTQVAERLILKLEEMDAELAACTRAEIALARNQPAEALAALAHSSGLVSSFKAAALEAEARTLLGDADGALAIIEQLRAQRPASASTAMLAVRTLVAAKRYRQALELLGPREGWSRLAPDAAQLATRSWYGLATEAVAKGNTDAALDAVTKVIEIDSRMPEAWFLLVDAAARTSRSRLDAAIERFENAAASQPALVVSMAERLSSAVRSSDDPLAARLLAWINDAPADGTLSNSVRSMARARIYATVQDWPNALVAVEDALKDDAHSVTALKLRAEVLSWSGRHADAVAAYASYLEADPTDRNARRQQARVAGWGGAFSQSKQLYSMLLVDFAGDRVIEAEARAKAAYFDGRWKSAAGAYSRLVALEPDNSEAGFELAESLRAARRGKAANTTLQGLSAMSQHRLAGTALHRDSFLSAPSMVFGTDIESSSGYGGQRLLDLQHASAGLAFNPAGSGRFRFAAHMGSLRATSGDTSRQGAAGEVTMSAAGPAFSFDGRVQVADLESTSGLQQDFSAVVGWMPGDRWTFGTGVDRTSLRENMTTVEQNISGSGPFVRASFQTPRTSVDVRSSWQQLSDDNDRQRTSLTISHLISERVKSVRLVAWAEQLAYGHASADYFSPAGQFRIDAGVQYSHAILSPRFRSDRRKTLSAGYLVGTDNDGVVYHHPSIGIDVEFANGLALDARADVVRSSVYHDNRLIVSLRLLDAFRQTVR